MAEAEMYPSGVWYNELGSQMNLTVSGSSVWGWYYSAVGRATNTYTVQGQINPRPYPYGQALGWAVAWTNAYASAHSATSWSGQYQSIDGEEEIIALWLLTREMTSDNDWQSTLVGKDTFTRTMPSPEEIEKNRRRMTPSHPIHTEA
jgi:hypothetical protein